MTLTPIRSLTINFSLFLVLAGLPIIAAAQNKPDDTSELNQQIVALYQQGKFDAAIPIAEKVVSIESKNGKNAETHALALANLAQLYKEKTKAIRSNMDKIPQSDRLAAFQTYRDSAEKAKKYLREALEIYQTNKTGESAAAAAAKNELAWLVFNFLVTDSIAQSREQIDQAEKLYTEALATEVKLGPAATDLQLRTLQNFADFYLKYVNFEKALPLYERYVTVAEGKYGQISKELIPGLRGIINIYAFTDRESEAKTFLSRIQAITGQPEKFNVTYLPLTARAHGIATVKAPDFVPMNMTDQDRSFSRTRQTENLISPPAQYKERSLEVDVLVNENGDVIEAKATTVSKFGSQVEEAALASKFRPFVYNGISRKLRGKIVFRYREY